MKKMQNAEFKMQNQQEASLLNNYKLYGKAADRKAIPLWLKRGGTAIPLVYCYNKVLSE